MVDLKILDSKGKAIKSNFMATAFEGASGNRQLMRWAPPTESADAALLPNREALNNRSLDISRNNGFASSGVQLHVDHIVGESFKLSAKPDAKLLGVDLDVISEWAEDVERKFAAWAEDPDVWIDAERKSTFTMLIRQAVSTHTTMGEITGAAMWLPDRGSDFATAIKMIDPARVSNPNMGFDKDRLRAGVEIDRNGAARAYYVRNSLMSDFRFMGASTFNWVRIAREESWGRVKFMHVFEPSRADQTRGINSFAAVLKQTKMLDKFEDVALQNAIINAMYAAVIESDMDQSSAFDALGGLNEEDLDESFLSSDFGKLFWLKNQYHDAANFVFDGAQVAHLFPGEKLNINRSGAPQEFAPFQSAMLRSIAASLGTSYEQLSRDYSKTNYSSARAAILEAWRYFTGRRVIIAGRFASMIYSLWLEEAMDKGIVRTPAGAPSFWQAKSAWTRSQWIGAGLTQIDGLKETKQIQGQLDYGLTTLEQACAQLGKDYQEVLQQRARETKMLKDLGLPVPWENGRADLTEAPGVDTNAQTS